jgi:hypothetical protein
VIEATAGKPDLSIGKLEEAAAIGREAVNASGLFIRRRGGAVFSADRLYRYLLLRRWAPGGIVAFLMLNPSTADEYFNDPTVERCERRARALGAGAIVVANLFAFRSTDPAGLKQADDPIGPENGAAILEACRGADRVVCAWGTHGGGRGLVVLEALRRNGIRLECLGVNADGSPKHPLYVPYAAALRPFGGM